MENDSIDRLLRAAHAGMDVGASPDCLDAETLAAWMEDRLGGPQQARAEAHAAGCARCQSMLAVMARTEEVAANAADARSRSRFRSILPWAAPLTAAATAAALYLAVRPDAVRHTSIDQGPSTAMARTEPAAPSLPSASPSSGSADAGADATPPRDEKKAADADQRTESALGKLRARKQEAATEVDARRDALADLAGRAKAAANLDTKPLSDTPASALPGSRATPTAPPAPPPAPASPARVVVAPEGAQRDRALPRSGYAAGVAMQESVLITPVVIASPDPKVLWRIDAGRVVQQSTDGGATWATQSTDTTAFLAAGAAPSPTVCWIAGQRGLVLVTTDGRTWRRVTFPEPVDLSAIRAESADAATVTTADGRVFSTKDGGKTWQR
jgi:hypothetical protein